MVVTFGNHPRQVLCPDWQPALLSTPEEKETLLRQTAIDRLVVLPFDAAMSRLTARQFMEQVLRDQLDVRLLLTGYDNHFGHRSTENETKREGFADYQAYGRELGIEVMAAEAFTEGTVRYSSSLVRQLLAEGDVAAASECLGRPYSLTGSVVRGEQIGRQIGFPTANIEVSHPYKIIPRNGVYAVAVQLPSTIHSTLGRLQGKNPSPLQGVMNIGHRPTFDGHRTTLEVHILDFDGDLYGQTITVSFLQRLRDERHFDSPADLIQQMKQDVAGISLPL